MKSNLTTILLASAMACGGMTKDGSPRIGISHAAKGAPGGGGGGGGGGGTTAPAPVTRIPPPPTVDGAADFLYNSSGAGAISTDVDYGNLQNSIQGGVAVGANRVANEIVFNTSKKTALAITAVVIAGANPADFSLSADGIATAIATQLPANQGAGFMLPVTFSPTDGGTRTAVLEVISNAGVTTANLTGVGIPPPPKMPGLAGLDFLSDSAPDTLTIANGGGSGLVLQSIAIAGANPEAFVFTAPNFGFGNCFSGIELATNSDCVIGVGVAQGATGPASATLVIVSNDPVAPETDVPITLTPAPVPTPADPPPVEPAPVP